MLTLYDTAAQHQFTVPAGELSMVHRYPWPEQASVVLSFEFFDPKLRQAHENQITAQGFRVKTFKGWVVGVREALRDPAAIFDSWRSFQLTLLDDYAGWGVPTADPPPHPLIHLIPDGLPGAGVIVVRDTEQIRQGNLSGVSFVARAAARREAALSTLSALGFTPPVDAE